MRRWRLPSGRFAALHVRWCCFRTVSMLGVFRAIDGCAGGDDQSRCTSGLGACDVLRRTVGKMAVECVISGQAK